eukprot:scaffold19021_cov69-Cylindrotheca_fusiformis.AAC.1
MALSKAPGTMRVEGIRQSPRLVGGRGLVVFNNDNSTMSGIASQSKGVFNSRTTMESFAMSVGIRSIIEGVNDVVVIVNHNEGVWERACTSYTADAILCSKGIQDMT